MNPEVRHTVRLRIRVARGRVVGETIRGGASGENLMQPLQYLKIGRDEFTYGFMNGMRPWGMLLWTVRRKGDHFEGEMRWGGVAFRMPDGSEPPTSHVTLRKAS